MFAVATLVATLCAGDVNCVEDHGVRLLQALASAVHPGTSPWKVETAGQGGQLHIMGSSGANKGGQGAHYQGLGAHFRGSSTQYRGFRCPL